jgi:hypothetical protein
MHVQEDSGSLENLSSSFEAGSCLLGFFPPNEALAALASLKAQFLEHKAFKNKRMAALGWQFGPSAGNSDASCDPPADPQAVLADGRGAAHSLQEILDDIPLCSAVFALMKLSPAAKECDKRVNQENLLGHYDEALRLQVRLLLLVSCLV